MNTPTPIWDGFVRGYHWLQAGSIVGLWYTGTEGLMDWHFAIAYLMLALLLSRLIWGVIGSETARFRHFIHSPSAVLDYLRSLHGKNTPPAQHLGHNPAGGYMVLMFFVLLSVQLTTGLFANDDIISEGPLAMYVSSNTSSYMTYIHAINFNLLLAAIGVHLAAILLYLIKKENLIKPMLSGRKVISETVTPKLVNGLVGWVIFAVIGGVIYIYWAKDIVAYLL
ncbi:cytochrome b/b6 domain-containing protein [Photobacterium sp. SDRW27]|uniref:cytochrome b/b6 domain-containing protein n=1 Tax=Photobacterium obscurum TaxID=2829490 RepID=UPI002244B573|nr:cytochrome b/b6 domain-containing protein [Photobacterium obscurum]MCW8329965.1 cytochrome b/b6 domain-containing protein [Photobacterium obscurum]